jgi:hypothetical protein
LIAYTTQRDTIELAADASTFIVCFNYFVARWNWSG